MDTAAGGSEEDMTHLETGDNGLCKCTLCKNKIPKGVPMLSLGYRSQFGLSFFRLCGVCIMALAQEARDKQYEKPMRDYVTLTRL
jgi:hypothetical protein